MTSNYSLTYLRNVLKDVRTIAIIGASSDPNRDSNKVMKYLIGYGFEVFPVNPKETNILGRKCYANLSLIKSKINMVDVFRAEEFIFDITKEAISIDAKILWTQEGIIEQRAASLGRRAGLIVIMNECPKKVLEA